MRGCSLRWWQLRTPRTAEVPALTLSRSAPAGGGLNQGNHPDGTYRVCFRHSIRCFVRYQYKIGNPP